jgi:hypothetical protein
MSRASVTTFGRGVSFVASGETGTQANEFEAAIKSVTSSITVGAVFLYDTRSDSDGGAWRKKTSHTSWAREAASVTRSARSEFPSVALIVSDSASGVTIYDLDDPSMPVWMVFQQGGSGAATNAIGLTTATFSSIAALNGIICVGGSNGGYLNLQEINLLTEEVHRHSNASDGGFYQGNIAERNGGKGWGGTMELIVDYRVNDVAMTVLEGAEIGALGLPIPTVAVATGGGVSVIHPNGSVNNIQSTNASYRVNGKIQIDGKFVYFPLDSTSTNARTLQVHPIPYAAVNPTLSEDLVADKYATASTSGTAAMPRYLGNNTLQLAKFNGGFAVGTTTGLSVFKDNEGNRADGMVSHHTSGYCTGYMLGDIRFAGLAGEGGDGRQADRSVKLNNLTAFPNTAAIHETAVATDAELKAYSNFSASNYLSDAYDADFDFGTGDFSIMFWCKLADTVNATETVLERAHGGNALFNIDFASGVPRLIAYNGSAFDTTTGTRDLSDNQWHQLMCFRKSGVAYIYIDGKQHVSNAMTYDLDNSQAILHIGQTTGNGNPLANGSLSLVRISATAPTPQQVKDIYEAEAPLFRAGAKCLLQSDDASPNVVNDLSYDASTDLLHVFQNGDTVGENLFRGLEVIESRGRKSNGWTYSSASYGASAGGVSASARALSGGGVIVDLPPFDVRGDTNIADSKLPDDGKFHFSGVTTNATPTVIGQIPIAENESYTVIARVMGLRYNTADSSIRHYCEIKQQFTRRVGGDVVEETQISKLEEGDWAALDVDLDYATGADTVRVKVTGDGSSPTPYRVVWNAEVEVQRISEKTYER